MSVIKEHIKTKSVNGVYLLYGEEAFLKDFYSSQIVDLCTADGPKEFNLMKINSTQVDTDEITEFAVSMPFMADKKILCLKNTGLFSKANDTMKKFWTELFSDLPDYLVIVFNESTVDKRSALFKAVTKSYTAEEFPLSKESELINWFARILQRDGKAMAKEDICFVIENVGRNMYLLKSEAEKLIAYTAATDGLITREDAEACVCKSLEGRVFDLIDNITVGNKKKAIDGIADLKALKEQPVMIVALIFRQFSNLRKIKSMEGASVAEIAAKTKLRDFVVRKNLSQLKHFSMHRLDEAIFMCNEADKSIKFGLCEPWLAVEKIAISLMENTKERI